MSLHGRLSRTHGVLAATVAAALTGPIAGRGQVASSSSGAAARPVIAVVAPGKSPAFDAMPKSLRGRVDIVRVNVNALDAQEDILKRATGLLWIPTAGSPSGGTPSETLAKVWPKMPKVTWVHSFSAGVEVLLPFGEACVAPTNGRIVLTNGRGAFSSSLAEYSLAAMLYFNKQLKRVERNREAGIWDNFVMDTMEGKTVGLVGYGSIGKSCGRAAKGAFGCRVVALRRRSGDGDEGGPADRVYGTEEKEAFFQACDFVVCSLPSTPATQKYIAAAEIGAMKPSAVLVSIGRGAAIDETALAEALAAGAIRGAALDVFTAEPLPKASPFWGLSNVLLTSHNADFTADYFELGWRVWGENFDRFSAGKPLSTPVDIGQGY